MRCAPVTVTCCLCFARAHSHRKSLDLVEALIRLSDAGHYQPVVELFKFPLQHCPDVLVFALLQIVSTAQLRAQESSSVCDCH